MRDADWHLFDLVAHPVFVLVADEDGIPRYRGFNKFACNVLGRDEAEVIGKTAREIYSGRLGEIAYQHHVEAFRSGMPRSYELSLPISSLPRRICTTLEPYRDESNRVTAFVGSSEDVTGGDIVREIETDLDMMTREMEDFVSLAAHDLRSPITQVHAIADLLREDFKDLGDGKIELIDLLEDVGAKAMELISDVLSHAQATSTRQQIMEFDLAALCRDLLVMLDPLDQCVCEVGETWIYGDRNATQIVLRNLIDNALKHARPNADAIALSGEPAQPVQLNVLATTGVDGMINIQIRDSGAGFSGSTLKFLGGGDFSPDSGFGLLGVRRLIRARGGSLTAMNAGNGKGAIVAFSLPGRLFEGRACALAHG
ncbi:MAG: ATP-binding protein [Pseudomonadota bacterium]